MPEFKNEQNPKVPRAVAPTAQVFVQETVHRARIEVFPLQGLWIQQDIQEIRFQFLSEPVYQGNPKALLRPVDDSARNLEPFCEFL